MPAPAGPVAAGGTGPGTIRWTVPGHARVHLDAGGEVDAVLPRRVRPASDADSPVVVGDRAVCVRTPEGVVVESVGPRSTTLARRASGTRPVRQVIAANADRLLAVFSAAQPEPRWSMLDRYLVIAESAGIEPVIVITKMELAEDGLGRVLDEYRELEYHVRTLSVRTGEGLDALRADLAGRRSVLVGKSGVGKSTLLNALVPGATQQIGVVSEANNKGRHTTTLAVLFPFEGGTLTDTPGVREIALWGVEPQHLSHWFREMVPHLDDCRFAGSCTHSHEVGCGVKQAVEGGAISKRRYASYMRLLTGEGGEEG